MTWKVIVRDVGGPAFEPADPLVVPHGRRAVPSSGADLRAAKVSHRDRWARRCDGRGCSGDRRDFNPNTLGTQRLPGSAGTPYAATAGPYHWNMRVVSRPVTVCGVGAVEARWP